MNPPSLDPYGNHAVACNSGSAGHQAAHRMMQAAIQWITRLSGSEYRHEPSMQSFLLYKYPADKLRHMSDERNTVKSRSRGQAIASVLEAMTNPALSETWKAKLRVEIDRLIAMTPAKSKGLRLDGWRLN